MGNNSNNSSSARRHIPDEELHAYCDGELSPSQRSEVLKHLLACLICRAAHGEVLVLRQRTSELLAIASPRTAREFGTGADDFRSEPERSVAGRMSLMAAALATVIAGTAMVHSLSPAQATPPRYVGATISQDLLAHRRPSAPTAPETGFLETPAASQVHAVASGVEASPSILFRSGDLLDSAGWSGGRKTK